MTDWKDLLAKLAPTVATALGGPLAGLAVNTLSQALFNKPGASVDDVSKAVLGGDPAALAAVQQAEIAFQQHLADLQIHLEDLDVTDRASARQLAIARGITPQVVITAIFILGYFGILTGICADWLHIPAADEDLVKGVLETLLGGVTLILNFWFGSTHGSQKKDAALAAAAQS